MIIIAQNWKDFKIEAPNVQIFSYEKLGILKARKILRQHFLDSQFDYMIMADDDMVMVGDPKELLEGMENHPDGFAYCEDDKGEPLPAQLNLFAISKFIYTQQPMVNIDPQKGEGVEDNIFTHLLRYKWKKYQWHYKGIKHIQYNNKTLEDFPPSTWWEERNKVGGWKVIGKATTYYRQQIEKGNYDAVPVESEAWNFPIDFVLPYVDNNEKIWLKTYREYCYYNHMAYKLKESNGARFESFNLINYTLRCVNQFMPWIRKIHLIVSNIEQVPKDIDMSKVHVVLHSEIMPKHILPTFNSSTIEMFLGNIDGLAEHFIYGNDDIMPIKPLSPPDFFTSDGLPKLDLKIVPKERTKGMFDKMCARQYYEMASYFGAKIDPNNYVRPDHGLTPLRRTTCRLAYQSIKTKIEAHLEPFRNEYQHQQYLYALYEFFRGTCAIGQIPFHYFGTNEEITGVRNEIVSGKYSIICYNDVTIPDRSILPERIAKFKEAIEWVLANNNN